MLVYTIHLETDKQLLSVWVSLYHSPVLSQQWGLSRQVHSILSSEEVEVLTLPDQSSSVMEEGGELERYSYSGIVARYCCIVGLILVHFIVKIKTVNWTFSQLLECIKTYAGGVGGASKSARITVLIVNTIILIITGFYHLVRLGWSCEQVTVYQTGHAVTTGQVLPSRLPGWDWRAVTALNKLPTTRTEHLRYRRKIRDNARQEVERGEKLTTILRW